MALVISSDSQWKLQGTVGCIYLERCWILSDM